MKLEAKSKQVLAAAIAIFVSCSLFLISAKSQEKPRTKVVELDSLLLTSTMTT